MSKYLETLKALKVAPNFFCSDEYFEKAGITETIRPDGWICLNDENWLVSPPIHPTKGAGWPGDVSHQIWCDFDLFGYNLDAQSEFLDYEYIYDPKRFLRMEGKQWAVFRKNVRKFPKRYPLMLKYIAATPYSFWESLKGLLINWLVNRSSEEVIQDDEVMKKYVLHGNNRKILFDSTGHLLGVNVWDDNYKYINFRFSICEPLDFLNEYMRYLFYTDEEILDSGRLVNDGGALGNPKLEAFKDKLNPIVVKKRYSWRRASDE